MNKYLGYKLSEKDFLRCHKFGSDQDGKGPQNIMIRFSNPKTKMDLMKKRGNLKTSPLFFKEFLTDRQYSISFQAREAKRFGILQKTWAWDGLIWGLADDSTKPGRISDYSYIKEQNRQAQKKLDENPEPTPEVEQMEVETTEPTTNGKPLPTPAIVEPHPNQPQSNTNTKPATKSTIESTMPTKSAGGGDDPSKTNTKSDSVQAIGNNVAGGQSNKNGEGGRGRGGTRGGSRGRSLKLHGF